MRGKLTVCIHVATRASESPDLSRNGKRCPAPCGAGRGPDTKRRSGAATKWTNISSIAFHCFRWQHARAAWQGRSVVDHLSKIMVRERDSLKRFVGALSGLRAPRSPVTSAQQRSTNSTRHPPGGHAEHCASRSGRKFGLTPTLRGSANPRQPQRSPALTGIRNRSDSAGNLRCKTCGPLPSGWNGRGRCSGQQPSCRRPLLKCADRLSTPCSVEP